MQRERLRNVYAVVEHEARRYWQKVGVGFVNKDGSINVKLQAWPKTGELEVRSYVEAAAPTLRSASEEPLRQA